MPRSEADHIIEALLLHETLHARQLIRGSSTLGHLPTTAVLREMDPNSVWGLSVPELNNAEGKMYLPSLVCKQNLSRFLEAQLHPRQH